MVDASESSQQLKVIVQLATFSLSRKLLGGKNQVATDKFQVWKNELACDKLPQFQLELILFINSIVVDVHHKLFQTFNCFCKIY